MSAQLNDGDVEPAVLTLSADRHGTEATVAVAGEVDLFTAPRLRSATRALMACGATDFVLDLAGVTFFDSSGLNVLIELADAVRAAEGSVVVEEVSPWVRRLLSITAVDTVVTVRERSR